MKKVNFKPSDKLDDKIEAVEAVEVVGPVEVVETTEQVRELAATIDGRTPCELLNITQEPVRFYYINSPLIKLQEFEPKLSGVIVPKEIEGMQTYVTDYGFRYNENVKQEYMQYRILFNDELNLIQEQQPVKMPAGAKKCCS